MAGSVPLEFHDATQLKPHEHMICWKREQARDEPAQVRQMSHNHDGPGFLIEAHASRLDIIVRRHARNLHGPVCGMEFRRQDLGSLPRPQFIAVFDTIESHATFDEMLA